MKVQAEVDVFLGDPASEDGEECQLLISSHPDDDERVIRSGNRQRASKRKWSTKTFKRGSGESNRDLTVRACTRSFHAWGIEP